MLRIFLIGTLLMIDLLANGQDIIVSYKGDSIRGIITSIDTTEVHFQYKHEGKTVQTKISNQKVRHIIYHQLEDLRVANDSAARFIIYLRDGSLLYGMLIEIDTNSVLFETPSLGQISIKATDIIKHSILKSGGVGRGKYFYSNPHATRHFFGPTAINLEQGEGYFQDIYVFLLSTNYGITNNFSIGGAISIIPGLGIDEQLFMLNPKIGYPVGEKIHLGGGLLFVHASDLNVGIVYSVGTLGTYDNNITLGIGYGFYQEGFAKPLTLMLGGMYRISNRISLVSENWMLSTKNTEYNPEINQEVSSYEPTAIVTYGLRFFGEQMAVDFAFLNILGKGSDILFFPGIPYLDFVIKF